MDFLKALVQYLDQPLLEAIFFVVRMALYYAGMALLLELPDQSYVD